jgi:hypothetical protein
MKTGTVQPATFSKLDYGENVDTLKEWACRLVPGQQSAV